MIHQECLGQLVIVNKLHHKKVVGRPPTNHFFTMQLVHDYLQDLVRIKYLNIKKTT